MNAFAGLCCTGSHRDRSATAGVPVGLQSERLSHLASCNLSLTQESTRGSVENSAQGVGSSMQFSLFLCEVALFSSPIWCA